MTNREDLKLLILAQLAFMVAEEERCGRCLFEHGHEMFLAYARSVLEVSE